MAQPCGEERYRQSALSQCSRLPGWTVRRHCRELCPAVLGSRQADRGYPTHLAPAWCTAPPQSNPQSVRRRGRPPVSSRAAPPRSESSPRPARRASHRSTAPPVFQLAPISSREAIKQPWHGQPGDVGSCSISGDGEDSATPSPEGGLGENHSFCSAAGSKAHIVKERAGGMLTRPRTILPAAKRVRLGDAVPPHAPLASPYRDSGSSARMSKNAGPSVPSSLTPICCITVGTSIVPLEPLARCLEAWLALPSPSCWLTRKIRLRLRNSVRQATSQVQRRSRDCGGSSERSCLARGDCCPPGKGCNRAGPSSRDEAGVLQPLFHRTQERRWSSTNPGSASLEPGPAQGPCQNSTRLCDSVRQAISQVQRRSRDCGGSSERSCLARGDCCPPCKGCNRAGPSSRDEAGVLQPLFHHTQERRWSSTNPGSASLEPGPAQAPVKMLTHRRMIKCIQPRDWLAAIDLKDAYFHVSILPRHKPRPRVGHGSTGSSPSGSPCPPRVFTKVAEGALAPLREVGIRILSCLEHGPHARTVVRSQGPGASAPQPVGASGQLEKSKLSPVQRISFLGVELDSVSMTAHLTDECAQSVLNCLSSFRGRTVILLKQFQRLLGHMASAAAVTPLGLLHMRPLQHWLHSRVPRWAWRCGTLRVNITQECRHSFSPWTDLAFLRAGVPLEQVSRHVVVTTDASSTGWGATCNGQAASGLWTGPRLLWHINCLELLAGHLALRQFWPLLLGKHVLVRTDNTAAVSYINRMGGIRSHRMSQLARHLLLGSHTWLKSLRAVHIPGELNREADALSRQLTFPGEWRLHPEMIRLIWSRFGEAQVDLFASRESSHCQLYFSLTEGPLGTDALAHSWPRALCKYAFPPVSLLAQTLCKVREDEEQVRLVAPVWPTRTWFPELILLATAPPWRIPLRKDLLSQGLGTIWHPRPDLWYFHVWLLDGTR